MGHLVPLTHFITLMSLICLADAQTTKQSSAGHHRVTTAGTAPGIGRPAQQPKPKPPLTVRPQQGAGDEESTDVTLQNGMLTIVAHDASLTKILDLVSRKSGMLIEGDITESRVYGSYGPDDVPSVLSDLLLGLGYNILMVGNLEQGVPQKLTLTNRGGAASPPQPDKRPQTAALPGPAVLDEPILGPGAIAHPPPATQENEQIRVQQNLQRLQQMHEPPGKQGIPP